MPRPTEFDANAVVHQAMEVFWTQGYTATSIQDLVDSTGVLRGSLYHTFSDKHTLYVQALTRYGEIALRRANEILAQPGSHIDGIRQILMDIVDEPPQSRSRGSMLCNAIAEVVPQDTEIAQVIQGITVQLKVLIQAALDEAKHEQMLDARKNTAMLATYLVSSLQGLCVTAKAGAPRDELEDIVDVTMSALR